MKIAFDHQIFVKQHFGGISRYFVTLAENFLQMNHHVRAFAPLHQNFYLQESLQDHYYGKYFGKFPPKSTSLFLMVNKLLNFNTIDKWGADVIHETYYSPYQISRFKSPLIVTVHDMVHEIYPDQTYRSERVSRLKKKKIKQADHIICISENTRRDLNNFYDIPQKKISIIHHGPNKFNHTGTSDKYDDINELMPYVLFVGNRSGYKNFKRLLEVFHTSELLKEQVNLIAFGGGNFTYDERNMISNFGITQVVHHIEGDDKVLGDLYDQALLFIYPSLYEGFGMPTLEAMSCGCPVVASNTSSIPEVVGDAAELFEPLNVNSMRVSIEELLDSKDKRDSLIRKGHQRLEEFSWKECAQKTLAVYQDVLQY